MLKVAGILLVVSSCAGLGYAVSRDLKQRIEQLCELKKLILMLQGEIKYMKAPLPEAFAGIAGRIQEPFRDFFDGVACDMNEYSGLHFQEIWDRRIRDDLKETKLTKQDLKELRTMGETMGYLDHEMQLGTLGLYIEQLDRDISGAQKAFGPKSRIYHCLGLMGGIFLSILLL